MVQDLIRYDILAQEALRGVIRKVLSEVAKAGLPGNHHFFITFLTEAPGVRISSRLKEKYPEQMTIVLQHQFWDLQVTEQIFEVGLSFGDVPERLIIPFSAIRGFYDPSVNFELEFDVSTQEPAGANDSDAGITTIEPMQDAGAPEETVKPKARPAGKAKKPAAKTSDDGAKEDETKPSADVVSLDAFRKNK
ncbi:hypothetical protein ATN84_12605 [Paramesorhizobium deserti]|uniref:Stringent starvation protein B n=1 Tax=Paramesorhizobium deserti TaxID=1494590 RepID=A0A135HUI9_9HYPH|nr:SspB family protein [Paramesorhizobium deserti]KXF76848.1 hypothetical protein ATN84_12605 [Paramesorhizobium deserti]